MRQKRLKTPELARNLARTNLFEFDILGRILYRWSISSTFYMHIFCIKVLCTAFFYLHLTREKWTKSLSYEKGVRKTLMKLTPGQLFLKCVQAYKKFVPKMPSVCVGQTFSIVISVRRKKLFFERKIKVVNCTLFEKW